MQQILIVGAGFSGAVIARELAEAGLAVTVADARPHVAGNCHTERCPETGVLVHVYGPHIFHTDDAGVWDYVNRFARFMPYVNRVKATVGGRVYALPVNLHTINQFFGLALRPDEARAFVAARTQAPAHGGDPANFEEQALAMVGPDLYQAFFRSYTAKQWGCDPRDLPASILKRLPLRFSYDDNYFFHRFQGMPEAGYTALVAAILDHPRIRLELGRPVTPAEARAGAWDHVIWTGPLDAWFGHDLGRLGYRTLDFERFTHTGDWQGCAVMNHPDADVPYTRVAEHRHFAPWETPAGSVVVREYPRAAGPDDIPYYPIRLAGEQALLARYAERARAEAGVSFAGRLGTYRYLDMDVTIREALEAARSLISARKTGQAPAVFLAGAV
ncbi:UDP-galactopyranose/dTDP-fucopyranose mutase family protein [Gemmobacter nectariphilus]|uniref:UDP-galactopyranose/dTDP-fucopyranose mutase family protein n=1 Tax=Gemmobacter nectariphilus TaxID=220343 RepID=UPI0004024589|nr:FAD-dependent oxidoreductase [Gemmobacter nectariphilus]